MRWAFEGHQSNRRLSSFKVSGRSFQSVLLNTVSSGYTASKVASRMIFTPDRRPKIIPPAPFSLSNPDDPAFNNNLAEPFFCRVAGRGRVDAKTTH
jgi:hypothetical protein